MISVLGVAFPLFFPPIKPKNDVTELAESLSLLDRAEHQRIFRHNLSISKVPESIKFIK